MGIRDSSTAPKGAEKDGLHCGPFLRAEKS
jgi:hypothetical protein